MGENTRRAELITEDGVKEVPFMELKKGDRFRLFEQDGTPVDRGVVNLAVCDAYNTNGVYGIQVEELLDERGASDADGRGARSEDLRGEAPSDVEQCEGTDHSQAHSS